MMYRPKDWNNPHRWVNYERPLGSGERYNAWEAGADAMLEGLRKFPYGGYRTTNQAPDGIERNGLLVFIPDDTP